MTEGQVSLTGGPEHTATWVRLLPDGNLEIEFYDFSGMAHEHLGGDVAYIATVQARHVPEMAARLDADLDGLLPAIEQRFGSYFAVLEWLDHEGIAYAKRTDGLA